MTENAQFFLLLGDVERDGVLAKLKATGTPYRMKRFESKPENWKLILELLEDPGLTGVVVKLTTQVYNLMCRTAYGDLPTRILRALQGHPHIVFVHEEVFTGVVNEERRREVEENSVYGPYEFSPPRPPVREYVNGQLDEYGINVVPYTRNVEMATMALAFLDQNEKNLVFRLYVPTGRMWAAEAEKLLQLFRDYLGRVANIKIRQDQYGTPKGTVYEFFSDHSMDPSALPVEFGEFSTLLDLCATSPSLAVAMLENKNVAAAVIHEIVDRYSKEARRLHVDLKHDRERKVLSIRQRMENELVEVVPPGADWSELTSLVDQLVPNLGGISTALGFQPGIRAAPANVSLTINHGPQIVGSVQGIVAQEVTGTQHIGPEATQLLDLIERIGDPRRTELISAVHEIEDPDSKKDDRLTAGQKLKGFLFKATEKVADAGISILVKYVEKQIGL